MTVYKQTLIFPIPNLLPNCESEFVYNAAVMRSVKKEIALMACADVGVNFKFNIDIVGTVHVQALDSRNGKEYFRASGQSYHRAIRNLVEVAQILCPYSAMRFLDFLEDKPEVYLEEKESTIRG